MRFTISDEVLNKALGYIGSGSYVEVFKLIQEIQGDIKPVEVKPNKPEDNKKPEGKKE